jgi:glutamyl/glutaminyl-tRNA synthetase
VPFVTDGAGERLAKRKGSVSLEGLRVAGVDPRAVVEWVAGTCGSEDGGRRSAREALPGFLMERVPREPVRLTDADLEALERSRA